MDTIYLESHVADHPRAVGVKDRFPSATVVECERYGEVFNHRAQNFRLQKKRPSLILAEKHGKTVLPAPPDYSIGRSANFYFSHMLNCLYDCRYCFLQGMYQSANYVYFVNFEDFEEGIDAIRETETDPCFFSGYDCDSLVMESITGFAGHFVPFFSERPDSWFELRTKSLNTRLLDQSDPVTNIIPAFTLSPDPIAREIEHGAPPFAKRLEKVESLTRQGWMAGLRLDPLLPWPGFVELYQSMVDEIFSQVDGEKIHSVTLGPMRFPKAMYEKIVKLYPCDPLFALGETELRNGQMTYPPAVEEDLVGSVTETLLKYIPDSRIFRQTG